jgi:hypothetical protein
MATPDLFSTNFSIVWKHQSLLGRAMNEGCTSNKTLLLASFVRHGIRVMQSAIEAGDRGDDLIKRVCRESGLSINDSAYIDIVNLYTMLANRPFVTDIEQDTMMTGRPSAPAPALPVVDGYKPVGKDDNQPLLVSSPPTLNDPVQKSTDEPRQGNASFLQNMRGNIS